MMINNFPVVPSLIGGALIGLAAAVLLLFNGRIAGNSGIIGGIFTVKSDKAYWRLFYVAGLFLGAVVYRVVDPGGAAPTFAAGYPVLILAGLLVGYGTRLGSGCTSGHGVCGLARCSRRSIVSTVIFMLTAIVTVYVMKLF